MSSPVECHAAIESEVVWISVVRSRIKKVEKVHIGRLAPEHNRSSLL